MRLFVIHYVGDVKILPISFAICCWSWMLNFEITVFCISNGWILTLSLLISWSFIWYFFRAPMCRFWDVNEHWTGILILWPPLKIQLILSCNFFFFTNLPNFDFCNILITAQFSIFLRNSFEKQIFKHFKSILILNLPIRVKYSSLYLTTTLRADVIRRWKIILVSPTKIPSFRNFQAILLYEASEFSKLWFFSESIQEFLKILSLKSCKI